MELIKNSRRRSFISNLIHVLLNIAVAVVSVIIIEFTESLLLAILVVLISKWRVLAVRPRFWFANIQSNLVDYTVNLSIVILIYLTRISEVPNIEKNVVIFIYFLIYLVWLTYIKPKSKRSFMAIQSGFAIFLGTSALYNIGFDWWATPVVAIMWIIGYGVSRHLLSSYDESKLSTLALYFGLIFAELGWVVYQWTVAYIPLGVSSLSFPRASLTILCLSIIAYKCYDSIYHHQKVRWSYIKTPISFSFCIIVLLPLMLSLLGPNVPVGL